MHIIILSGGSGVRLWPLSKGARAKQFLPLLKNPDGGSESMLQRVIRQISEAGLDADVTITANKEQRDILVNQIGDKADYILEPEQRNTFPAIALAVSYLLGEKRLSKNEPVIVMPSDAYCTLEYFKTLKKMEDALEKGAGDIILMGVQPTSASIKYGYIIPEVMNSGSKVRSFQEKPDKECAENLVKEGALWNAGVFAFRLGYLMDIVSDFVSDAAYESLLEQYASLPKMSFDCQVLEKASDIAFVCCDAPWSDLGTWDAFADVLPQKTMGNAYMGEDCQNTCVVNELDTPVFVNGLKDVIVAASLEGMLVCSRKASESLKGHVETLLDRPMFEERRWGTYRVVDSEVYKDGFRSLTKSITLKAGKNISYQVHHHRSEVWTFVDGEGLLMLDDELIKVSRGYVANIAVGQKHAVKALTDLTFIEVQTGDILIEEDIDRLKMDWPE